MFTFLINWKASLNNYFIIIIIIFKVSHLYIEDLLYYLTLPVSDLLNQILKKRVIEKKPWLQLLFLFLF